MFFRFINQSNCGEMKKLILFLGVLSICSACDKSVSEFQTHNFIKYYGKGLGSSGIDLIELSDGGFIFTGYDMSAQLRKQVIVARTDKAGNLKWERQLGSEHLEEGQVVKLLNENIIVSGNKTNFITGISEAFLLKLNLQGDSLDYISYSAENNLVIHDMAVSNEYIFIAGEQYLNTPNQSKYFIACLDHSGEIIWERIYGSDAGKQSGKKIFLKGNGNILLVGSTNAIIGSSFTHISVAELNSSGVPMNAIHFPADSDQEFNDAFYHGSELFVLFNTAESGRLVSITETYAINRNLSLGFSGKAAAMLLLNENSLLIANESSNRVNFHSVLFSAGEIDKVTGLRSFPGQVRSIKGTSNGDVIAVGTNSATYGSMVRLIKTDGELYLLKP
jgi:hypothetical protein